jgi:hypothetical protein
MLIQARTDGVHVAGLDGRKELSKIARRAVAGRSRGSAQTARQNRQHQQARRHRQNTGRLSHGMFLPPI